MSTSRVRAGVVLITPNKPYQDFLTWMACFVFALTHQLTCKA